MSAATPDASAELQEPAYRQRQLGGFGHQPGASLVVHAFLGFGQHLAPFSA